jgi:hypothetical protein
MPNALSQAGAVSEPSNFAPLNTDRIFTGLWTNRNPLRDAATTANEERYYGARQDSIIGGYNTEVSTKLTLRRRPGNSVYNSQIFPPVKRFYSWNQFTLASESIRVLADTAATVYDATGPNTKTAIWTKSAGAGPTFFLGVGNNLYFTNGVENKQMNYPSGTISNWGIAAPTIAPTVSQAALTTPYPSPVPNAAFGGPWRGAIIISDPLTNTLQQCTSAGTTGSSIPSFNLNPDATTQDGTTVWTTKSSGTGDSSSSAVWQFNHSYSMGDAVIGQVPTGPTTTTPVLFVCTNSGYTGMSGATLPGWQAGLGSLTNEGSLTWTNCGAVHTWSDIGAGIPTHPGTPLVGGPILNAWTVVDPNGYLQAVAQNGKTGPQAPTTWNTAKGGFTTDGGVIWVNTGPLAIAADYPTQYGFAYQNSLTGDISNMSPASAQITLQEGNHITVTGARSTDPQVNNIIIYRLAQGGSTYLYVATIPNPATGMWSYVDNIPDSGLNVSIQAQVNGEGTPLPVGATCMEYHLGRIWAAVGNVVYGSSGPDAVASTSSGNSGFDLTFTCQSKITRMWTSTLGLAIFTVRDVYLIQGDGVTQSLFMTRYIDNLPLLNYDAFTVFLTTPYLFTGKKMVGMLAPSAGIVEQSYPIADLLMALNPQTAYLTFHSESSAETALYVSDGTSMWYRLAPTSAPESGSNWSPQALVTGGMSCLQSVETQPGEYDLLIGPPATGGPILMRDMNANTDDGAAFTANTRFGSIVVAQPGELAGLAWMTLEAQAEGTAPALSVLLSEIDGEFENVPRSRQDPPNLPPSQSLYSNRHSLMQNQMPTWCRHFQFQIDWPAEDEANELLSFTIFGETWHEMRSQ